MSNRLALFDFDGTITRKDTFLEFIKFVRGKAAFYAGIIFLIPVLAALRLKLIPNWRAKEKVFAYFFKGMPEVELSKFGNDFANRSLPSLLRPSALKEIENHLTNATRVVIVTASAAVWIKAWTDRYGIELIASDWEVANGRLTGKLKGRNCYGPEKEMRIVKQIKIADYEVIYAYGDTSGDREMLKLGTKRFYKFFRD